MRIAVIGAGAMGSIYGGKLSQKNEVYLVEKKQEVVDSINERGLILCESGKEIVYRPTAVTSSEELGEMELVILFVKALYSKDALKENKNVIGENTYVMTLQNGSGHEDILSEFVRKDHIIIGTTEDNGAVLAPGYISHGGRGRTNIGMLCNDEEGFLEKLKTVFNSCGFDAQIHANIQQLIWEKLFTNISLSVVTGILQADMGFIAENPYAWDMTARLVHEAVGVADALGLDFDEEAILEKIRKTSEGSPKGCTSIRADLRDGRKTEVDTISGSVVRAAKKVNVPVPVHEFVVNLIHAMEDTGKIKKADT